MARASQGTGAIDQRLVQNCLGVHPFPQQAIYLLLSVVPRVIRSARAGLGSADQLRGAGPRPSVAGLLQAAGLVCAG